MIENHTIKLTSRIREIMDFVDYRTFHLYIHLLLCAKSSDTLFMNIEIKRGQLFVSYSQLQSETELTTRALRTSLEKLEKMGLITKNAIHHNSRQGMLITLLNFEECH